jgi:hypothetical protein
MSPVNFRKFLVNRLRDIQFLSSSDESVRFLCVFSVYLVTLSGYGIRGYIYYHPARLAFRRPGLYLCHHPRLVNRFCLLVSNGLLDTETWLCLLTTYRKMCVLTRVDGDDIMEMLINVRLNWGYEQRMLYRKLFLP